MLNSETIKGIIEIHKSLMNFHYQRRNSKGRQVAGCTYPETPAITFIYKKDVRIGLLKFDKQIEQTR